MADGKGGRKRVPPLGKSELQSLRPPSSVQSGGQGGSGELTGRRTTTPETKKLCDADPQQGQVRVGCTDNIGCFGLGKIKSKGVDRYPEDSDREELPQRAKGAGGDGAAYSCYLLGGGLMLKTT